LVLGAGRARKAAKILLALAVAAVAALYVYQNFVAPTLAAQNLEIDLEDIRVESVGLTTVKLDLVLSLYNPNPTPAALNRLDYDIYLDDNYLGHGWTTRRVEVPPYGHALLDTELELRLGKALEAALNALGGGGHVVTIKGVMHVDLPGATIDVPFEVTKSLS